MERGCKPLQAHRLMLRTLFTAYLEARGVLSADLFEGLTGSSFAEVLTRVGETRTFFERMRETFNGDLFPPPPQAAKRTNRTRLRKTTWTLPSDRDAAESSVWPEDI